MNAQERDKLTAFIVSLQGRTTFTEHEVNMIVLYLKILHELGRKLAGDWGEQ